MSKRPSFASLAIGAAALVLTLGSASASQTFPGIGDDSAGYTGTGATGLDGPALIITLNPGGTGTITNGPNAGIPYDGVEDTYIGLVNSSGQTVNSVLLSAPHSVGIFGFDGDGIAGGSYCTNNTSTPGGCGTTTTYGTPNASDTDGYGGPIGYFTNINTGGSTDFGTLNLIGGLIDGGYTWFSLEEPLDAVSFTAQAGSTPLPGTLPLFVGGLGMIGGLLARKKRKAVVAGANT